MIESHFYLLLRSKKGSSVHLQRKLSLPFPLNEGNSISIDVWEHEVTSAIYCHPQNHMVYALKCMEFHGEEEPGERIDDVARRFDADGWQGMPASMRASQ